MTITENTEKILSSWYALYSLLEEIYDEKGENVLIAANKAGQKEALADLRDAEIIEVNEGEKGYIVSFTKKGETFAANAIRRQRIMEIFLHNTTFIPMEDVHEHAANMSFSMNNYLEKTIYKILNYPERCLHGNDIPHPKGISGRKLRPVPLSTLCIGTVAVVEDIGSPEDCIKTQGKVCADKMINLGILPRWPLKVVERIHKRGPVIIEINGKRVAIGRGLAEKIFVVPVSANEGECIDIES